MPVVVTAEKASTSRSLTRCGRRCATDPDTFPALTCGRSLVVDERAQSGGGTVTILRPLVRHRGGAVLLLLGALAGAICLAGAAPGPTGRAAGEQAAAAPPPEGFVGISPVRIL